MTTNEMPAGRLKWLSSNLTLGLLVVIMTIFTAVSNYATYVVGGQASDLQTQGDRLLAESNAESIRASQLIVVDFTTYNNYYVQKGVDDFAAEYYQSLFSPSLTDSVKRAVNNAYPFDDQYYSEMYGTATQEFSDAFDILGQADAVGQRQSGFQLAMLVTAMGLAFAAYASLLNETNRLRQTFSLMSSILMIFSVMLFIMTVTK